ncbi:hypothetical protein JCM1840_001712 [Sporobolomyces johnsonii]
MPKPVEPDKIPIASAAQLRSEFDALLTVLALDETEHTWEKIDKAVKRFQAVVRGGAAKKELAEEFVRGMRDKQLVNGLVRSLLTERTRLSGTTLDLIASSTRLGAQFAPLLPLYLPTLLRLLCRTNKLYISRSASTIASIIKNTKLGDVLRFIAHEWHLEAGKSSSFREKAAESVSIMLGTEGVEMLIEKEALDRRIEDLEWIIKTGATDREPKVRAEMKKCWQVYQREWPERVYNFTAPMTPVIRRYLNITVAPSAGLSSSTSSRPVIKKPRVPASLSSSVSSSTGHSAVSTAKPHHAVSSSSSSSSLSKSHGPSASSASARNPLSTSTSRAYPPLTSAAADGLSRSVSSASVGVAVPSHRPARIEPSRTASGSTSSSRSESFNEERTTSHHSAPTQAAFKPTAPLKASTTASRAAAATAPFKPATRTAQSASTTAASSSGMTSAPAEPRKARRVAAAPPPPPPVSNPPPASTLTRSTSTLSTTTSTLGRSHTASSSAPFRPHKPTSAHPPISSKSSSSTASSSRAPLPSATRSSTTTTAHKPSSSISSRAPLTSTTAAAPSTASASTRTARAPKPAPPTSAATLAARERRERKAAEAAVAEAAKRKVSEEEERRKRDEVARAREVPLPTEAEGEERELTEVMEEAVVLEEAEAERDDSDELQRLVEAVRLDGDAVDAHEEEIAEPEPEYERVLEEVGMDSTMVIESLPASQVPEEETQVPVVEHVEEEMRVEEKEPVEAEVAPSPVVGADSQSPQQELFDEPAFVETPAEEAVHGVEQVEVAPSAPAEELELETETEMDANNEDAGADSIRPVSDVPPSPFIRSPAPAAATEPALGNDEEDLAVEEAIASPFPTDAPALDSANSTIHAIPAQDLALPDVSIAFDSLAIASETDESMLADASLPLPLSPFMIHSSASTPLPASPATFSFPTPTRLPRVSALPAFSPEPCQTASIVLDTPPRLDELPGAIRLPGRPVVAVSLPSSSSTVVEEKVTEAEPSEDEEEEEDDYFPSPTPRSPAVQRRAAPPTPSRLPAAAQRQPVFFPDSASASDIDTTFEQDDDEIEGGGADESVSFEVPLNDASAYGEYDDSDVGADEDADEDPEQGTPKATTNRDHHADTEEPIVVQHYDSHGEDESALELEQPELRFHDETESEQDSTVDFDEVTREEVEQEEREEEKVEQPNILKRSLRSRVVTVDLQAAKTPARSRSRDVLSELQ